MKISCNTKEQPNIAAPVSAPYEVEHLPSAINLFQSRRARYEIIF